MYTIVKDILTFSFSMKKRRRLFQGRAIIPRLFAVFRGIRDRTSRASITTQLSAQTALTLFKVLVILFGLVRFFAIRHRPVTVTNKPRSWTMLVFLKYWNVDKGGNLVLNQIQLYGREQLGNVIILPFFKTYKFTRWNTCKSTKGKIRNRFLNMVN